MSRRERQRAVTSFVSSVMSHIQTGVIEIIHIKPKAKREHGQAREYSPVSVPSLNLPAKRMGSTGSTETTNSRPTNEQAAKNHANIVCSGTDGLQTGWPGRQKLAAEKAYLNSSLDGQEPSLLRMPDSIANYAATNNSTSSLEHSNSSVVEHLLDVEPDLSRGSIEIHIKEPKAAVARATSERRGSIVLQERPSPWARLNIYRSTSTGSTAPELAGPDREAPAHIHQTHG